MLIFKVLKKVYSSIFPSKKLNKLVCEENLDRASELIFHQLEFEEPCMIERYGAFEISTIVNYLGIINKNIWKYIKGESQLWWWNKKLLFHMVNNAGFFPTTEKNIEKFCKLMLEDIKELNILGSWIPDKKGVLERDKGLSKRFLAWISKHTRLGVNRLK